MSALAPTLQAFFTDRLVQQRHASPHTIAAYRDAWRLLVRFAAAQLAKAPSQLEIGDINAPLVGHFLAHLEHDRANTVRTRNARLSAIHALFRYAALDHPEQAAVITSLRCADLHLSRGAYVNCLGKGRKQRITPLTRPVTAALRTWLAERDGVPDAPVFPTRTGQPLSRDALAQRLAKHVATAAHPCPSLREKTVTPHTLRHTAAMRLLHAGVDTTVIALWLGHEHVDTTSIYIHADLTLKERALARTTPACAFR